jgi:hypothetical protein
MNAQATGNLEDQATYQPRPDKSCDVVMKGGITSGVIYPKAICELARHHRLRQVGGSSAGAIAAAAAAAAELGRDSDSGGYAKLAALPGWLAGTPEGDTDSNLFHLFQPQKSTSPYYRLFVEHMKVKGKLAKFGVIAKAALMGFPVRLLLPVLIGLVIGLVPLLAGGNGWDTLGVIAWTVLGLIVGVVLVALGAINGFMREVDANGYGLCKGAHQGKESGPAPLSDWLTGELDELAGMAGRENPLTFGDLADAGVDLSMMTTGISTGTPYRLPFETKVWHFDPVELVGYFPQRVIDAMVAAAPENADDVPAGYHRLPDAAELPVIVAVRMSLSFPVLLSAVPLWAFDYTKADAAGNAPFRQYWFSDGGIVSNFPLHFFDKPLPAAPTFGINLAKRSNLAPEPADNTNLPTSNVSGILPRRFGFSGVVGFLMRVLDTMQNWSDSQLTHMPGYRDRVVTVYHNDAEGGINLNMTEELINGLSERGQAAGVKLATEFDLTNHRWVRYRSTMQLIETLLAEYREGFEAQVPEGTPSFAAMIEDVPPTSYRQGWSNDMKNSARQRSYENGDSLVKIAEKWAASQLTFADGAPRPTPAMRIGPKV